MAYLLKRLVVEILSVIVAMSTMRRAISTFCGVDTTHLSLAGLFPWIRLRVMKLLLYSEIRGKILLNRNIVPLIIRIIVDILGIAIDVYVRCIWKPLQLPNVIAGLLSTAACLLLLFDILRCFVTIVDIYSEN